LKHHNWVILALKGDEPVGFYLLADHPGPELPFSAVPIGDGQVWAVDLFVRPEFRSCYVGRMMQIYRDHLLLSEGYREHVSTVRKENLASLRLVYSMKPETIKYLTFRRLFWKTDIRIDEDAREEFEERMSADRKKQVKSKKGHMGQAGVP
jgi:hypothetical protein